MKQILRGALLLALAIAARAQEILPREEAVKAAAILNFDLEQLADTPIPTDADVKRPYGLRAGHRGVLVVPEAKLTSAAIASAGSQTIPIGQLWLAEVVPMRDGDPIPVDELKMVEIEYEGHEITLPVCVLGVRRGEAKRLEILVYGRGAEPLLIVPLREIRRDQAWPIEMAAQSESDVSARLTLVLAGVYQASFSITIPAPKDDAQPEE